MEEIGKATLTGTHIRLEPLDFDRHLDGLTAIFCGDENADLWQYMSAGPFEDAADFQTQFGGAVDAQDLRPQVIIDQKTDALCGMASFMRMQPEHKSVEIGYIAFGMDFQRTVGGTEAIFMMLEDAIRTRGYQRVEWKCNADNAASKSAAIRYGFTYEGEFRRHMIIKGKNRDTAWFSILGEEWPRLRERYIRWLSPDNFDESGIQKRRLQAR